MDELGQEAIPAPSLRTVDEEDVRRIVDAAQPDLIIHTAAMSDIPTCENDPEGSYYANVKNREDSCLACTYRDQVCHVQH